ncbi:MAG: lectin [Bradyrhizobium sp.]
MTVRVRNISRLSLVSAAALFASVVVQPVQAQSANTTFFVTSAGPGNGANLGGLDGADKHCQTLAAAAGAGARTWHAYLSTQAADGKPAVSARDRIGKGPWQNSKGVVVAKDVADLHSASNNLSKQTSLSEKGEVINGRGDAPNRHDALTGSQPDGTAFAGSDDRTCTNWTSSTQGAAMLGHIDRIGLRDDDASKSWNSSHPSRGPEGGCSQADLRSTGGDGLLYCFAAN